MEEKTADEIAAIFSAAGDSVTLINTAQTSEETDDDYKDKIISFKDPWHNEYRFSLDASGDNTVNVNGQDVKEAVAVWSAGPDGVDYTGDDVKSWH